MRRQQTETHVNRQLDADLTAHQFLFGMSRQDVGLLADCAVRTQFDAGDVIFREGEEADRLYLVESGCVTLGVELGSGQVVLDSVGPGELLGLSWLFPPHKWRTTARACEPTVAIHVDGDILRDYAERDHTLGYELYKRFTEVMTQRLEKARRRHLESTAQQGTNDARIAGDHRCE